MGRNRRAGGSLIQAIRSASGGAPLERRFESTSPPRMLSDVNVCFWVTHGEPLNSHERAPAPNRAPASSPAPGPKPPQAPERPRVSHPPKRGTDPQGRANSRARGWDVGVVEGGGGLRMLSLGRESVVNG